MSSPRECFEFEVSQIYTLHKARYIGALRRRQPNLCEQDYEELLQNGFLHLFVYDTLFDAWSKTRRERGPGAARERLERTMFQVIGYKGRDVAVQRLRRGERLVCEFPEDGTDPLDQRPEEPEAERRAWLAEVNRRIEDVVIPRTSEHPWVQEALRAWWRDGGRVSRRELGETFGAHLTPESARTTMSRQIARFERLVRADAVLAC